MRKGFLHLVEIIVVSLVAFVLMFQFYSIPQQQIDWEGMRLSTQANDMLFSLDRKGVDWTDATQIQNAISSFISKNMIYTLGVKNAIRPQINVSCICNDTEFSSIQSVLQPFQINGQTTNFNLAQVQPDNIYFSHNSDVVLVLDYNLTNNYTQISQFLHAGKGIVEVRNLQQGEVDSVQADFFGLEWNSTIIPDSSPISFRSNQTSEPYYNIFNYFHSIPLMHDNFSDGNDNGWTRVTGAAGWYVSNQYYMGWNDTGNNNWSTSLYSPSINDSYSLKASFMSESGSYDHNVSLIMYYNSTNRVMINFDVDADRVSISENGQNRGSASFTMSNGIWYRVDVVNENKILRIYLNGTLALTSQPLSSIPQSSQAGLSVEYGSTRFDDVRATFSRNHNFTGLPEAGKIQPSGDYRKSVLRQRSSGGSACIINQYISGENGRTAWLAPGAFSTETQVMLKALLVWAAGEEYNVIDNDVKNAPVVTSFYKVYDQDMFQPVQIVLSMGYAYT
jgi:hypothetical protein